MKEKLKSILYFIAFPILFKTLKFKNLHFNEEVYIIADSSELRFIDIKKLDDKPAIFFNNSYFINGVMDRTQPTYTHLIESFYFYKKYKNDTRKVGLAKSIKKLLIKENIFFFTNLTNIFNFIFTPAHYVFNRLPMDKFTKSQLSINTTVFRWSMKTALSLAIYMGFKKAYLIGFSFSDVSLANHWYDDLPISLFSSPPYKDAVDKLKSIPSHNNFFVEAETKIEIIGISLKKPKVSYLKWVLYEDLFGSPLSKPKSPHEMTKFKDVILFQMLQRNSIIAKKNNPQKSK